VLFVLFVLFVVLASGADLQGEGKPTIVVRG